MEAATLTQKKKINRTKLKKTIKNVLCRPDPVFWPEVSNEEKIVIQDILSKYKVTIPEFTKLHWKILKSVPKDQRPKPPEIEKVDGLIFGISECLTAIKDSDSLAILIESEVNPRTIVQPVLDACLVNSVPVTCIEGLRKTCATYFGIPTACLGVKKSCLIELSDKVKELVKDKLPKERAIKKLRTEEKNVSDSSNNVPMDTTDSLECPYLYRSDKKTRVFVPPSEGETIKRTKPRFAGQDFIQLAEKTKQDKKAYIKMLVKKISNNPNRGKLK